MTNEGVKLKLLEICHEIERKDEQLVSTGKIIVDKLWKCVRKLKIEESNEFPVDSLHNVMKNLEILTLDIEDKVDQATVPDKRELLEIVQNIKWEAEDRQIANQKLKEELDGLR